MSMQLVTQSAPGGADTLEIAFAEKPQPAPGQLRVRVLAAGINRADIVQREGKYPPPKGASPVLGLEIAGIVDAVNGPSRFQEGDAVFGLVSGGGYAEYALLDSSAALPKPDLMSWAEAASLPEAWMTAWFNLVDIAALQPGETVLIHAGASGVGAAAIQLASLLGARVVASAGSEEKRQFCRRLGADEVIDSRQSGFAANLKAQGGVDVVLDPGGRRAVRRQYRGAEAGRPPGGDRHHGRQQCHAEPGPAVGQSGCACWAPRCAASRRR